MAETTIPVLDLDEEGFENGLLDACRDIGFVAVTGHGIESAMFARMRSLLARLFGLDDDTKAELAIRRDNYRGFIPLGFFTPNRSEAESTSADRYEGYKLHWECPPGHPVLGVCDLYGPNRWPPGVPQMTETVAAYWAECDRVAGRLLDVFAAALGVERAQFRSWHDTPLTNMTLLHYPAGDGPTSNDGAGIHPHKDTNVITLLHPDPVGGLQVRRPDGSWIEVDAPEDALIVNIGEMLELWSGGEFVATPHRVTNTTGLDRYSFPFFVVPNHDVVVAPLGACDSGFKAAAMPVGRLSAEVWRTNWPDEPPSDADFDLGTLDR